MSEATASSLILWPFEAIWWLVSTILSLTGRLVIIVLGVVFMLAGGLISATLIGAVLGIPILFFGVLLVLRGLF